ncbi:hypothetical protein Moror_15342, partial [Moniliophthora roreri MCA 2997]
MGPKPKTHLPQTTNTVHSHKATSSNAPPSSHVPSSSLSPPHSDPPSSNSFHSGSSSSTNSTPPSSDPPPTDQDTQLPARKKAQQDMEKHMNDIKAKAARDKRRIKLTPPTNLGKKFEALAKSYWQSIELVLAAEVALVPQGDGEQENNSDDKDPNDGDEQGGEVQNMNGQDEDKAMQQDVKADSSKDNEEAEEEVDKELALVAWQKIQKQCPKLLGLLDYCLNAAEEGVDIYHYVLKKISKSIQTQDTFKLKDKTYDLVSPNQYKMILPNDYQPKFTGSKDSCRSHNKLLSLFLANQQDVNLFRQKVNLFDNADHWKGLQIILTSPSSVYRKKTQATQLDNASICGISRITGELVPYIATIVHFTLSSMPLWRLKWNGFNYCQFYYNLHKLWDSRTDAWKEKVTEKWN